MNKQELIDKRVELELTTDTLATVANLPKYVVSGFEAGTQSLNRHQELGLKLALSKAYDLKKNQT